MNLSEQEMLELEMDDGQLAMHQIVTERQHRAQEIAKRIRVVLATVDDAIWIEAEYGCND